jgi:hypothetical protein
LLSQPTPIFIIRVGAHCHAAALGVVVRVGRIAMRPYDAPTMVGINGKFTPGKLLQLIYRN